MLEQISPVPTLVALEAACRKMLAQKFDDICWLDIYREIGAILNIPFDPKLLPRAKFLGNCARFYDCMARDEPYDRDPSTS